MAKKTNRVLMGLQCVSCKSTNYISEKNKINNPDKMEVKKYCRVCKKSTGHKEKQKLK